MADVESLELQITADAEDAKKSLDALIDTLNTLKQVTTGGAGLGKVSKELGKIKDVNIGLSAANTKTGKSFGQMVTKALKGVVSFEAIRRNLKSWIGESNEYTENMNLFTVAMGQYAEEAMDYANTVSDVMGIDTSEWIRNQGVFMTLATGFGVAGDRAATMSQQLTQLGYDLSSFYNISVGDAMQKLQSGISGELEPLRRLGYDLSQAKLEATAASLGIDKLVSSMTQAEKAELRYYAIMTQVTQVQGDMARTLSDPANQLRILEAQLQMAARSLGNIFIPMLNAVIPYAIAAVKVFRLLADAVARLVGAEIAEVDWDSSITSGANSASDAIDSTTSSAKKLKKQLLGIDELNVMSDNGSGAGGASYGVGGFDFELPTYDFIGSAVDSKVSDIVDKMKEWLGITEDITTWADLFKTRLGAILIIAGLIGAALVVWKVIESVATVIDVIGKLKGTTTGTTTTDGGGLSKTTEKLKTLVKDLALVLVVILEVAAAAALIVGAIWLLGVELEQVGIAWEPVLANGETIAIAMGIGVAILVAVGAVTIALGKAGKTLVKDMAIGIAVLAEIGVAAALFIVEILAIGVGLNAIGKAWQPVLDNGTNIATAIGVGTGILVAIGVLTALLGVATTGTGGMLPVAIGLGTVMLAALGIAVSLFIVEIIAIGTGLTAVGKAWRPVLNNGANIATAIGVGTGLLVAIGVVAAALGVATVGTAGLLPVAIGLGTAMLVALGVAATLFISEIAAIGTGLNSIGKAWQPVLKNCNSVTLGIKTGTTLLIAVGVVAAALGVATVASAGLLPVAIGLGTALLVTLSDAFISFTDEIIEVANQLTDDLKPALDGMVDDLPGLSQGMEDYTSFMSDFAGKIVQYTLSSAIAGIATTVDKIIDFFTADPIDSLATEVSKQKGKLDTLVKNLNDILPVLSNANALMGQFNTGMSNLKASMGSKASGAISYVISVGVSLVKKGWTSISDWIGNLSTQLGIKLPHVGVEWVDAGFAGIKYPKFSVSYYAQGGFPDVGQMFIAREAGPELVGSIGNRSAVVNNDQIVSSVSQGVYQAVVAAMGQSGGSQVVEAKVNDKVLFEVVLNRNRQETMRKGYNPLLGGV